jgi:hypothetical protein
MGGIPQFTDTGTGGTGDIPSYVPQPIGTANNPGVSEMVRTGQAVVIGNNVYRTNDLKQLTLEEIDAFITPLVNNGTITISQGISIGEALGYLD